MDDKPYCTICGEEVVGEHRKLQATANFKTPTKEIAPGMHIPLSKPVTVYMCTNTNQCQRTGEYNLTKLGICEQCGYVYFPEGGWMLDLADKMAKDGVSDFEINCPKCKKSLNFTKEEIKKCWSLKFGD
ncbi:MAG: hypothetical protein P9M14_09055 [Candidatus Alcyoniella australis]|nr:hypothetical protein [Candidatus Alcyoniella australis]